MPENLSPHIKTQNSPETSFDAWKDLFEAELPYGPSTRMVEFALIGYWNMDKKGSCYPSIESIMKHSGLKSRASVKKALTELEDSGRWIIDRKKDGIQTNRYYPQFVKNPKKFSKISILEERLERKKNHLINTKNDTVQASNSMVADVNILEPKNEVYIFDVTDGIATSTEDPKIITQRDLEIKSFYLEQKEHDTTGEFAKRNHRSVLTVLKKGDVTKKGLNHINSYHHYVERYPIIPEPGTLGGYWISQYGALYFDKKYTYSYVSDIYHEELENFYNMENEVFFKKLDEVHTAMCVFGQRGVGFDGKRLKALLYAPKPKMDTAMYEMRMDYEETLKGIEYSIGFESRKFYQDQEKDPWEL